MNENELNQKINDIMDKALLKIEKIQSEPSPPNMLDGEKGRKIDSIVAKAHAECAKYRRQLMELRSNNG